MQLLWQLALAHAALLRAHGRASCPSVWPQPAQFECGDAEQVLVSREIAVSAPAELRAAVARLQERLPHSTGGGSGASVTRLVMTVQDLAAALGEHTDESYELYVAAPNATLSAATRVGALRGLETFAQLAAGPIGAGTRVRDAPRFRHRGALLDSSRHFLPVATLTKFLDAMAMNKLNVLHWHLTDSQGYALADSVSKQYGLDSGALFSGATYSEEDLRTVVAHADGLGIRVVPELDGPAHVQAWLVGDPGDVVNCGYDSVLATVGDQHLRQVLGDLVGNLATIFPDERFHFGTDEVKLDCMRKDPRVMAWVRREAPNHGGSTEEALRAAVASYIGMVAAIGHENGKKPIFWEEAFADYGRAGAPPKELPHDALVQVWRGWKHPEWGLVRDLERGGFGALKSFGWYLDNGKDTDWRGSYRESLSDGYAGGEAALWGEHIDPSNLFTRAFPRLSAVAEKLWSPDEVLPSADAAAPRLHALRCQMAAHGYQITDLPEDPCPDAPNPFAETDTSGEDDNGDDNDASDAIDAIDRVHKLAVELPSASPTPSVTADGTADFAMSYAHVIGEDVATSVSSARKFMRELLRHAQTGADASPNGGASPGTARRLAFLRARVAAASKASESSGFDEAFTQMDARA